MRHRKRIVVRRRRRRMRGRGVMDFLKKAGLFIGKNMLLPGVGAIVL